VATRAKPSGRSIDGADHRAGVGSDEAVAASESVGNGEAEGNVPDGVAVANGPALGMVAPSDGDELGTVGAGWAVDGDAGDPA
jgi:hypothetical protein